MNDLRENRHIPDRYQPGAVVDGRVTAIHSFGAFLELEPRAFALLLLPEASDAPAA